jgi:hypothetical protein
MAFKNFIDDTALTEIGATTFGYSLDMRYRTSLGRASVGVPVRVWVYAASTVAADTGSVRLMNAAGTSLVTVNITGTTAQWYVMDGYIPATDHMLYPFYGGNTLGTLTVYAVSCYEYADIGTNEGAMAATIALPTISAAGTVAAGMPSYVGAGTAASGTGTLSPTLGTHQADDIGLCVVINAHTTSGDATLDTANGWAVIDGIDSGSYSSIHGWTTVFWKRMANGSETTPVVADNGEFNAARIYVFRGCTTSGNPWDVTSATGDNDGDSSFSVGGATTTGTNRLVVIAMGAFTGGAAAVGSYTNADLASITEQDDTSYLIGGDYVHIALITGEKAAAGAYTSTAMTLSGAAYYVPSGLTIALKPP